MAGSGKMACMTEELGLSRSGVPAVTRLGEDDWRAWREVRLAALADAPSAFGSTLEEEEALREGDWRAMTRSAAIFVAAAGGILAGVVAGIPRQSARERGLGAMWVAPDWRGSGVAAMLAGAVIHWAREEGCTRVGLWVPADNSRARRFYESQGFQATGQSRPFPGDGGRSISEMVLELG
jgi:GNAT superfamily N-acetyltransferase